MLFAHSELALGIHRRLIMNYRTIAIAILVIALIIVVMSGLDVSIAQQKPVTPP
jgi:hypothetical protein